jgi:hypothetical protein
MFDTDRFLINVGHLLRRRKVLWAILAISLVARIALVLKGGQFFAPDELRYLRCFSFLHKLALFDLGGIFDQVLSSPDHVGFILAGAPAAVFHIAFLGIHRLPETQSSVVATAWVSGLCFAVPSVISIALVYAISRKAGAAPGEALLATFFMACSNAMFYYCRHLLPYDLSMALALFALWLGIAEKPTLWVSLRCGFIVGMAMMTYNGYWALCAIVLAFHVLYRVPNGAAVVARAVGAALGAMSLPAILVAISILVGKPYLSQLRDFAGADHLQGDAREGAVVPFFYFWYTEHSLALVWAAATLLALWYCWKDHRRKHSFVPLCLGALGASYGLLVLASVGMGAFPVFGRMARQLVPWLCFASAYGVSRAFHEGSRYRIALATGCAALAIQAGFNMSGPFRMHFPLDVRNAVYARYGAVAYDFSFNGPENDISFVPDLDNTSERQISESSAYVLVNAEVLYPLVSLKEPVSGDVVFSVPYPYTFRPFQYEGLSPQMRDLLGKGDYSMRLIRRSTHSDNAKESPNQP